MRAEFKQDDQGITRLVLTPESNVDRQQIDEFFQKEIPGYDHSLQYDVDQETKVSRFGFVPTLTFGNRIKEGFNDGRGEQHLNMSFGSMNLLFDSYTRYYEVVNEEDYVVEYGVLQHVFQYRELLTRINGYNGHEELRTREPGEGDRESKLL